MFSVKKNIIANMLGSAWTAVLSIAFIPLYIHFMGIDAYGLVGFYVTLQVVFSLLDMGLTTTLSRELARLSILDGKELEMRNVVRTLETIYWGVAVLIILIVFFSAEWLANSWLNTNKIPPETVRWGIVLMGLVISFRMPYGFYCGALLGLQRQVLLNVIRVIVETLRNGGVVFVLWLISPTLTAFFIWQAMIAMFAAVFMFIVVKYSIPAVVERATFSPSILKKLWRFAVGMTGISLLSVILVEADKLILSKMLSLDQFGYYVLASTVALGLNLIIVPIFSALQPRLTQLVEQKNDVLLRQTYHKSCQLMTVMVIPLAFVLCFFSNTILQIWTQDLTVSDHVAPILSILVIGTACNAFMNMPYALQLAHGWTRLSFISNCIAVAVLIPALLFMIPIYGLAGAASIWVALNVGYILFVSPIVHAKLLAGEYRAWIVKDVCIPSLSALIVVFVSWKVMPAEMSIIFRLLWVSSSLLVAIFFCAVSAKMLRAILWRKIINFCR